MAATFGSVVPVGYTFGVLAFLRFLRGWALGLGEERDGGWEWEEDGRNFPFCCSGGVYFRSSRILRSLRKWGLALQEKREGAGSGKCMATFLDFVVPRGIFSEFWHF